MADFQQFHTTTHPIIELDADWNHLLAHGLVKAASYIVRKNGSYYEAINGDTGLISYGGENNAGGTTGTVAEDVINAAIAVLTSGGKIFCRGATYVIGDIVTPIDNIELAGEYGRTLFQLSAHAVGSSDVIHVNGKDNVYIHDLVIDGNVASNPNDYSEGIRVDQGCNNVTVANNIIYNCQDFGVGIGKTAAPLNYDIYVLYNKVYDCQANLITMGYTRRGLAYGNRCHGASDVGIGIWGSQYVDAVKNTVYDIIANTSPYAANTHYGFMFESAGVPSTYCSVVRNFVEGTGMDTGVASSANNNLNDVNENKILNCDTGIFPRSDWMILSNRLFSTQVGSYAIGGDGGARNQIEDNRITWDRGIGIYTADNQIIGNYLLNCISFGIDVTVGGRNTLEGNHIFSNGDSGIRLRGGSDLNQILNNWMYLNTNYGLLIDTDSDFNQVKGNKTFGNTVGCVNVNAAGCANNKITGNDFDEGNIANAGTNTRAWLNYDPSANTFIVTINPPAVVGGGGGNLP